MMAPPRLRRRALLATAALASPALWSLPAQAAPSLIQRFGPPPAAAPTRVFAAGAPAAVLLACLAPQQLLGWPMTLGDEARALLAPVLRDRPLLGRLSGRGSTVSLEALLALGPDLIVDAGSVGETQVSSARRVAAQTGLPCALVDGRLADSPAQLRQLGALLGVPARGERLAAHAEQVLAAAQAALQPAATRPTVYLARGADGLETATAGAINAEIIEAAGGRNVADTGRPGLARVSLEQVLAWNPDWVLTQDRHFQRLARQDAGWRSLAAVRAGRLLLAPSLPFGWLDGPPSVNRLLGIPWLAGLLRSARPAPPGSALQRQAVDEALRFHTLFYGPAPARETVQGWLDGSA